MPQEIYNRLKEYLEDSDNLEVDEFNQKRKKFDVYRKGTQVKCTIYIKAPKNVSPYVEIRRFYGVDNHSDFFRGYNVLTQTSNQNPEHEKSLFGFKADFAYGFGNKGSLGFVRKSINVQVIPRHDDNKFNVDNQQELEKIKKACETLIDIDGACANMQPKRKFVNLDGEKEVGQDCINKYLTKKISNLQELLENGTMGVTYPSGSPNDTENFKARLWVDEDFLTKHPEIFPKEDISDSYWTKTWKPPFDVSNQESQQYWLLVKDSVTYTLKSYEEDATFNISIKNNKQAKTAKDGDVVLCYSIDDQAIIARAEVVEVQKNISIVLKINEHISPFIRRDLILQQDKLDFFDDNLFTTTESTIETALISLNIEQFNIINQIMSKAKPHNRILFGAPGTGKSFKLKQNVEAFYGEDNTLEEACTERVTFHPEYSYFDFVGSYKPVMTVKKDTSKQKAESETYEVPDKEQQGEIIYDFVPGPFARVLKNALDEKKLDKNEGIKNFVLIIEEINRAKVAAVFGDIFQLLDRNEEGESEYGINPSKEFREFLKLPEGEKLKLPDNMYIWATMNSADQGVYPMDTAFKRRWSFEYTDIDEGASQMQEAPHHKDWETMRKHVNELLQKEGINEDKQMGPFFLKKSELQDPTSFKNAIQNKVLMYLFEDAAKHKRKNLFKEPDKGMRYSAICKIFSKIYTKKEEGVVRECYTMADILEKLFQPTK